MVRRVGEVSVCNNDARCLWDHEYWNFAPETDPSKTLASARNHRGKERSQIERLAIRNFFR